MVKAEAHFRTALKIKPDYPGALMGLASVFSSVSMFKSARDLRLKAYGQSQNDPTPLGPGQNVPLSPYSQVIQAYQQAALDATDQSLIPGSERDLVRQYFSQLGEQSAAGPR